MFSHITLGTNNIERATKFYDAVLAPLGFGQRIVKPDGGPVSRCWIASNQPLPRFYIYEPFDKAEASAGNGTMVAFEAISNTAVDNAHKAGLSTGGVDAGVPGPRPHYGDGYYGAYLHDPDGNKIHVVHRGDLR
ncbi:VOC family protein [Rhodobacteraceae bacterium]|nr:VOC family protein [Paracoccaceae bacterium]